MPIPDFQTLMLPVLRAAANGPVRIKDIVGPLAAQFSLSEEERQEMLPSGRQAVLHNRVHWAKFHLSKAGLVESPSRGLVVASAAGRSALQEERERIDMAFLMRFPIYAAFMQNNRGTSEASLATSTADLPGQTIPPLEQLDRADEALRSAVRADLLDRVRVVDPKFFEQLIIDLLVAMGYGGSHDNAAQRIGGTGDGGIDGTIDEDRLGLDRIYIQAKRYNGASVSANEVRSFVGSLETKGASKGVFVTTSTFTTSAKDVVQQVRSKSIKLIDGEELTRLMIEYRVGVVTTRQLSVFTVDENYFASDD
ncbi:restriction endonuclease [Acuticoccus sp.]|uniref:restriction endonuclease n=1 Tax=Acuticoccus sp. TaxID=1904378 RepID=UPI003B52CAA2